MNSQSSNPIPVATEVLATPSRPGRCPHCGSNPELLARGRKKAVAALVAAADAAYADLIPRVVQMRAEMLTFSEIAEVLNGEGLVTRRGCPWSKTQVCRILARAASQGRAN